MRSPRRATAKTSSTRGAPQDERDVGASRRRRRRRPRRVRGVYAIPSRPVAVDELDVELVRRRRERARRIPRRYAIAAERSNGSLGEPRERLLEARERLPSRAGRTRSGRLDEHAMRREDVEPGIVRRHDERHDARAGRAELLARARPRSRSGGGRPRSAAAPVAGRPRVARAARAASPSTSRSGSRVGRRRRQRPSASRKIGSGCTRVARSRRRRSSRMLRMRPFVRKDARRLVRLGRERDDRRRAAPARRRPGRRTPRRASQTAGSSSCSRMPSASHSR